MLVVEDGHWADEATRADQVRITLTPLDVAHTAELVSSMLEHVSAAFAMFRTEGLPLDNPSGVFLGGTMYLVGGWTTKTQTVNTLYAYDPGKDTWRQLADVPESVAARASPQPWAEVLPSYDSCGGTDVPWLGQSATEIDLAPGASTTLTITADTSPDFVRPRS